MSDTKKLGLYEQKFYIIAIGCIVSKKNPQVNLLGESSQIERGLVVGGR